ncbi:MAG TPA: hypothetical protein VJ739_03190 [Gemmataceae bacterium]|nr:hypothetical protein [Gemmataceae bacterium]
MPPAPASARFPSTPWSCIRAAQDPHHPQFVACMNRLMSSYWRPVYHYLRAQGHRETAEDLTQAFFLRFLARGWLQRADPHRGRFRDFLRIMLRRFASDQTARAPRQAQFERQFVSIASLVRDSDRAYEPPAHETPEEAFDRQWKAETLAAVRRNLRAYYEGKERPEDRRRFAIFAAYHFVDRAEDQPTQDALAERFGVSREQVRYALEEVGKRYARFLRQEVRDQVGSEAEVDEELRGLL